MTREEALNKAINIVAYFEAHFAKSKEAREEATNIIEALEQEPCTDAISKQALLDDFGFSEKTRKWGGDHSGYDTMMLYEIQDVIESQPSVTPQEPKTGHWEQYGNSWEDKFKCSECGKEQPKILCGERIIGHWSDYCPNCGAKMQEVEV